jgi:polyisoprenoid-binding protein YceI
MRRRSAAVTLLLAAVCALSAAAADAPAAASHYQLDQSKSSLSFSFTQAGAQNQGGFKRFPTTLDLAADGVSPSRLEVSVDMTSLDSGDQERDDTLRSDDLFAVKKFPQAHFLATQFNKTAGGFEALGKLTIRNVTRDLRLPFTLRTASENGSAVRYLAGKTSIMRLDYGVGQGDWKATDQVGNAVAVSYSLRLSAAR